MLKKRCIAILRNILEFIDYCFNFNQRIVLVLIIVVLLPTDNNSKIILHVIFLNILNLFIEWIYNQLKNIEFEERKSEVFEILYKWFTKRKNIEAFEINNLLYNALGNEYNFYNVMVEFKNCKGTIKWHTSINKLLKEMDEKAEYNYLDRNVIHNIYDLNKYIEINCEKDKAYLKSNINNIVKCLIDKQREIDKINSIKKDNLKTIILSILLAFFASDIKDILIEMFKVAINAIK